MGADTVADTVATGIIAMPIRGKRQSANVSSFVQPVVRTTSPTAGSAGVAADSWRLLRRLARSAMRRLRVEPSFALPAGRRRRARLERPKNAVAVRGRCMARLQLSSAEGSYYR